MDGIGLAAGVPLVNHGLYSSKEKVVIDKGMHHYSSSEDHQALRWLMKHNTDVSNIAIINQNILAFSSTTKIYDIDFALKQDIREARLRYWGFHKCWDADVITTASQAFSTKNPVEEKKPSEMRAYEPNQNIVKRRSITFRLIRWLYCCLWLLRYYSYSSSDISFHVSISGSLGWGSVELYESCVGFGYLSVFS